MKRIGIIGENFRNDACAFALLLTPQYKDKIIFVPILKSLKGGYNSASKIARMLPAEMDKNRLDGVICTHDLDEHSRLALWEKWFADVNASIKKKGILYLAVMELEALILADIAIFNDIYGADIQYPKNPKNEPKPKEFLMSKTFKTKRKYDENHAEEIFAQLRFANVVKKHNGEKSFQEFIENFEQRFDLVDKK
jgi:hypothetical protein